MLADKLLAKDEVARLVGEAAVTPTLWHGRDLPSRPVAPFPYVVKGRHGCGQIKVVRSKADHEIAGVLSRSWVGEPYGKLLDEWLYEEIEQGILVEPYLGVGTTLPVDYKFFVFGGRATHVQVHLSRAEDHRFIVMSRDWRRVSSETADPDPPAPASLDAMIHMAERLALDFPFVRIDLYEIDGQPRFGEYTFYPGSGLMAIDPSSLDRTWGDSWAAARALTSSDTSRTRQGWR